MKRKAFLCGRVECLALLMLALLIVAPVHSQKFKKFKNKYPEFVWWRVTYPNGMVGFSVDKKKNIVVTDARGYSSVDFISSGIFKVRKGNYEGLVNKDGVEFVSPNKYNFIKYEYDYNGYRYYTTGIGEREYSPDRVGILNSGGKVVLPCEYKRIDCYSRYIYVNHARKEQTYFIAENDEHSVLCDTAGVVLLDISGYKYLRPQFKSNPVSYDLISNIIACIVHRDGKYGVCDNEGNILLTPKYDNLYSVDDTHGNLLIRYKENGKMAVADIDGNVIVAPDYDNVYLYDRGDGLKYFEVELNKKKGICDENGVEIIPAIYEGIAYNNGKFCNFVNGKFGEVIDVARYANPEEKIIRYNDRWVLSHNGNVFSLHPYDDLVWIKEKNRYYGSLNGYSTYIDIVGKEENSIALRVFNEAYGMPDANFHEKLMRYNEVLEIDIHNKENLKASALNNIGVMYSNAGDENTALNYFDQAAKLGDKNGIDNAKNIRKARKAAERAERMEMIGNALGQMADAFANASSSTQSNGGYSSYSSGGDNYSSSGSNAASNRQMAYDNMARRAEKLYNDLKNKKGYTGSSRTYSVDVSTYNKLRRDMREYRVKAQREGITLRKSPYEDLGI